MMDIDLPDENQTHELFIGGQLRKSDSEEVLSVEYPYTRDRWATVPNATETDVDRAVSSAPECFNSEEWQLLTATDRGELLFAIADQIEPHTDELARLDSLANGKLFRAMQGQVESLPKWYRYYGGLADKVTGDTLPSTIRRCSISRSKSRTVSSARSRRGILHLCRQRIRLLPESPREILSF